MVADQDRNDCENASESDGSDPKHSGEAYPDMRTDGRQAEPNPTLPLADTATNRRQPDGIGPGTIFGEYELCEEIARGGMGVVYRAKHLPLNRIVALKMILSGQLASEDDVRRFYLEAEAAASLDHAGIVPIYEIGQHGGQHFFSMKYVEGGALADRLDETRKDFRSAVVLLAKVARAVHHAHQRGILHRDLKPANILLDQNSEPLVSDLGLAKHLRGDGEFTNSGTILGTPGYMAPEQASGTREVTTAADIYSLGAILYRFLVGHAPHEGATPLESVMKVLNENAVRPRDVSRKIDRDLELICLHCLEKDPNARYSSAAALAEDLELWLAGQPVSVRPPSLGAALGSWLRNNFRSAVGAVVTGIITGFCLAVVFWMTSMSKPMSVGAGVYERFPTEPRPFFAVQPASLSGFSDLHWVWILTVTLMSIGLLNALLVRPTNRATMIWSGVISGLIASLVAFSVSIGWGSVFSSTVWPVHQDLQAIAEAAFADNPDDAARRQRALMRRYPDLLDASPSDRGKLVFRKVYMDQLTGIPIGLWLGMVGTLLAAMVPAVAGTLIAGKLMQRKRQFTGIIFPYVEIVGTASLACLFLVINSVARTAGLDIIAPPLHYQISLYASLLFASFAALSSWRIFLRVTLHVVWMVGAVMYFGEIGRTLDADRIASGLVDQGRLEDAAIRLERHSVNRRWEAFPQFSAAVLRARLGQWDRHRTHCRAMAQRFSRTSDPFEADQTAKVCLLSPSVPERETALRLADVAIDEGKATDFEPWFEFVRALAAYRAGNYISVEQRLLAAEESPAPFFAATATLLRSMTRRKLGHSPEADQLLERAHERYLDAAQDSDQETREQNWQDRVIFEILYQEAQSEAGAEKHVPLGSAVGFKESPSVELSGLLGGPTDLLDHVLKPVCLINWIEVLPRQVLGKLKNGFLCIVGLCNDARHLSQPKLLDGTKSTFTSQGYSEPQDLPQ